MSFRITEDGPAINKDPDDKLDYVIDLSEWLAGDTIASVVAATEEGDVEIDSYAPNLAPLVVTERHRQRALPERSAIILWLSGGTVPSRVSARCTTVTGRRKDTSFRTLPVEN